MKLPAPSDSRPTVRQKAERISPELVAAQLRKGRWSTLRRLEDRDLLAGLGSLDREELLHLSARVEALKGCGELAVRYTVAARLEVFFPDDGVVKRSTTLYEKVSGCGRSDFRDRASFRLGMIRLWRGDRDGAVAALSRLRAATSEPGFRARALYWLYLKEGKLADREALLREFPLTLHALLIEREAGLVWSDDSIVAPRSETNSKLNQWMEEAEALLRSGDRPRAAILLSRAVKAVLQETVGLRIYFSYLLGLAEVNQTKFWLLSDLIQREAKISKPLLQLLFPLKPEVVKSLDIESDEALLFSLIRQESKFNSSALSHAGAVGLMQVMPATAEKVGISDAQLLWDPGENVKIGTRYLHQLLGQYESVDLALAAYNAGPHRVDDWLKRYPTVDRMIFLDLIPFKETREYVAAIANNYWWYRRLYPEIRVMSEWTGWETSPERINH